jgi:hypothetical protein
MENTENEVEHRVKVLTEDAFRLSGDEILERVIFLGFKNDRQLYEQFVQKLREWLPPGSGASLRGSVVTNARHENQMPFDSKGIGTSDLDLTLHGGEVRSMFDKYYIPALHSKPLSDKDPSVASSELDAFRRELQELVGRPVNIHATADIVMFVREFLGQPYFMIIESEETTRKETTSSDAQNS